MKKRILTIILALTVAAACMFATSCYFDNDFYGTYHNEQGTVALKLDEDHKAVFTYAGSEAPVEYYAEYIIYKNVINLRDAEDGFYGKVMFVIDIDQSDITVLSITTEYEELNADGSVKETKTNTEYYYLDK